MKLVTWRNATLVLGVICCVQRYHACTRYPSAAPKSTASEPASSTDDTVARPSHTATPPPMLDVPGAAKPRTFYGIKIPPAIARLLPQSGENLRAYRDRMLPLAELAIAPQRARVARIRDALALRPEQRAELDAAVLEASTAIENRIMAAIGNGELDPHDLTPMHGIAVARDLLDIVDRGNTRFEKTLSDDQRTSLATHRFDFADYLLFSAPWETALHVLD